MCFVPESLNKPHRAEFSSRQFYLRVGSHSTIPSPSILRSLFYPQAKPRLVPTVKPVIRETSPVVRGHFNAEFCFSLENTGTATANDLFVAIDSHRSGFAFNHMDWEEAFGYQGKALSGKRPLHPGGRIVVAQTQFANISCQKVETGYQATNCPSQVEWALRLYARDMEPLQAKVVFDQAEIECEVSKVAEVQPLRP